PGTVVVKVGITRACGANGWTRVKVMVDLSEAWTTDWMSESSKHKLRQYGIAPPQGQSHSCGTHVALTDGITCPQCLSNHSKLLSEFGSTACKALYQCRDCLETFDYFKCI